MTTPEMRVLIHNGNIINERVTQRGSLVVCNDRIERICTDDSQPEGPFDEVVDATGCIVMPGVIDTHVHFREPGLTHKADILTESRAAAYGGVTSFFDMPNTVPQTTSLEALHDKQQRAAATSAVNYAFFFGATNDNVNLLDKIDRRTTPGVKLFMGSSTGNMLVDKDSSLKTLFAKAAEQRLIVMAHCEDTDIINAQTARLKAEMGDDIPMTLFPQVRPAEACYQSSCKAVMLATEAGARLHVAHVTTARELELFGKSPDITAEATVTHLLFSEEDYPVLGSRIKCNPSVKTVADRSALRNALSSGLITTIGTDHAPHLLKEKEGGALRAVSGMPMLQFSLVMMLGLADEGVLTRERVVELMCHNPAMLFNVSERGFIREGYKADLCIVKPTEPHTISDNDVRSKCGWTPLIGRQQTWQVVHTFCNGHHLLRNGMLDENYRGEQILFNLTI